MSEVIVVTSGKGGVGKTTTSANVGTGLAILGKRVVLIDTDIGLRNLDVVMGLENRIVYNLVDVVEGNCRIHSPPARCVLLAYEAGPDKRQKISKPLFTAVRTDAGQDCGESGTDG